MHVEILSVASAFSAVLPCVLAGTPAIIYTPKSFRIPLILSLPLSLSLSLCRALQITSGFARFNWKGLKYYHATQQSASHRSATQPREVQRARAWSHNHMPDPPPLRSSPRLLPFADLDWALEPRALPEPSRIIRTLRYPLWLRTETGSNHPCVAFASAATHPQSRGLLNPSCSCPPTVKYT